MAVACEDVQLAVHWVEVSLMESELAGRWSWARFRHEQPSAELSSHHRLSEEGQSIVQVQWRRPGEEPRRQSLHALAAALQLSFQLDYRALLWNCYLGQTRCLKATMAQVGEAVLAVQGYVLQEHCGTALQPFASLLDH